MIFHRCLSDAKCVGLVEFSSFKFSSLCNLLLM